MPGQTVSIDQYYNAARPQATPSPMTNPSAGQYGGTMAVGGTGMDLSETKKKQLQALYVMGMSGGLTQNQAMSMYAEIMMKPDEPVDPLAAKDLMAADLDLYERLKLVNPDKARQYGLENGLISNTPIATSGGLPTPSIDVLKAKRDELEALLYSTQTEEARKLFENADLYYQTNGAQGINPLDKNIKYNPNTQTVGKFGTYGLGNLAWDAVSNLPNLVAGNVSPEASQYMNQNPLLPIGAGFVGGVANMTPLGWLATGIRNFPDINKVAPSTYTPIQQ